MFQGFGLSLIYKGLDKYQEHETGVFVAKVVPGGQSQRAGLRENDKILMINSKVPHNVNDAVHFIKKAGRSLILAVERPDPHEDAGRLSRSACTECAFTLHIWSGKGIAPCASKSQKSREGMRLAQENRGAVLRAVSR